MIKCGSGKVKSEINFPKEFGATSMEGQRGLGVGKVVSTRVQSDSIASHRRCAQKMAALT